MSQRVLAGEPAGRLVTEMELPQGPSRLEVTIEPDGGGSVVTLWSWDEIEGAVEIKAFREPSWGSKVGVRVSSWMDDLSDLADVAEWLEGAVDERAAFLAEGV